MSSHWGKDELVLAATLGVWLCLAGCGQSAFTSDADANRDAGQKDSASQDTAGPDSAVPNDSGRPTEDAGVAESPALETALVPDLLDNQKKYNSSAGSQSSLVTYFDPEQGKHLQILAYFNTEKRLRIAVRRIGETSFFASYDIHDAIGGDALEDDSHNFTAVGVAEDGTVFVSGNQHVDPLRMARSVRPYDLTEFEQVPRSMFQRAEADRVTYPQFFNGRDGVLLFHYREQDIPSYFRNYLYLYNTEDGTWNRQAELGGGRELRMYGSRIVVDQGTGRIHVFYSWRDDSGSGSNNENAEDLFHVYSDDNGATWFQLEAPGTALDLPLTLGNVPHLIVDSDPHPRGADILMSGSVTLDRDGQPHYLVPYKDSPGEPRSLHHVFWDGGEWNIRAASTLGNSSSTALVTAPDGTLWGLGLQHTNDGGEIRRINMTPDSADYDGDTFLLARGFTERNSNIVFDRRALHDLGRISLLLTRAHHDAPRTSTVFAQNWQQDASVLTIDMRRLEDVPAYELETLSDTESAAGGMGTVLASDEIVAGPERPFYARLTVRGRSAGGIARLSVRYPTEDGARSVGRLEFGGSQQTEATPILPLMNLSSGPLEVISSGAGFEGASVQLEVFRASRDLLPRTE